MERPSSIYEAAFILDPFFPKKSDIKPHAIYGDTHAQSLTVSGLAPYRKSNINRLGAYFLDELRDAINIDPRF